MILLYFGLLIFYSGSTAPFIVYSVSSGNGVLPLPQTSNPYENAATKQA
ncbi:hypothetical protein [Neisseria montereyensis]|uniref:Uncharacterized protein n=1 Tax=Neisseria montereyensis TaxID=2973938 RepID=A0ABT2FAM6_9NEIS|nr:hypothetical protein [Neisseria montereyensis]MCS4533198.1 hypothetical protein [Neisseria montereyensis]